MDHMRLTPEQLTDPAAFAPQAPPAAAEAQAYAEKAVSATREEAQAGFTPVRVAYGADPAQRLDVYAQESEKLPVLLFFHGGAWIAGFPYWTGFMSRAASRNGALLVAATYRLAPAQRFPAQLDDATAALDWVRENIPRYGGDPQRIIVGGHSAGGHLAALVALTAHRPGVVGCFPVSAPLDIRYGDCAPGSPEERVYKFLLARREDDEGASPIVHAARARVPFHVMYGERDMPRISEANERFAETMRKADKPLTLHRMAGASHFDTHLALRDPQAPWYQALRKVLS
jgi:arylformamidase